MTTLNLSTGSFDQDNTFIIEVKGFSKIKRMRASLFCSKGNYYALQHAACLKNEYTAQDKAETDRLNTMAAVKHNDIVVINGGSYKVKVNGDFSDCAIFEKI